MADEIRQKIVLEGEKEYSAALKEANRNLKTLRSELKAETAELGANATAQQKAETKGRNLQKQIEQQKKIVDTYQAALKEVKERYGDNSDEVAKWEQKLNNARYTLATMNNDLERSQQDLKKQEDALKSAGNAYDDAADAAGAFGDATDAAGQIADAVTFQSVMTAADNLTSRLTNALNFIKDVGKAAWDWMSDSGEWADELETDSTKWGVDKETLQGWRYARRRIREADRTDRRGQQETGRTGDRGGQGRRGVGGILAGHRRHARDGSGGGHCRAGRRREEHLREKLPGNAPADQGWAQRVGKVRTGSE